MNQVLGEILPLALGVAVSPLPVIAAILMLLSPAARRTGPGFLAGWIVGIGVAASVFTLLGGLLPTGGDDGTRPVLVAVQLLLGALLLLMAARQWRQRPQDGAEPSLPAWMEGLGGLSVAKAAGLGAALAAANPKNLLLAAGAGTAVARGELGVSDTVVLVVVWTLLAACTVAVPVLTALAVPGRVAGPLDNLRTWLAANNATVMCVLLVVLGVNLVGKGIGAL